MSVVQLDGVTVSFRHNIILDGFSHAFPHGCNVILGDNGTGKSTLLGAIAGSVRYKGRILVNGHEVTRDPVSARGMLAYVPDSAAFYPFITGSQFTDFLLRAHGRVSAVHHARYAELVTRLDVGDYLGTTFGEASLGTRRKFFLLGALLLAPEVLILDEPFNGLDVAASRSLVDLINEIGERRTILLTCHHPAIVNEIRGVRWRLGKAPHTSIQSAACDHAPA